MIAACNGKNEAAPVEDDNLGLKDATQKREANLAMIAEAKRVIKDGDLILRTGNDYSSEQIKLFSKKDKTYSHGGIAFYDSGDIYVYHIVPDYFHVKDKVRKEKLDSFCNPAQNLSFGVARYALDSTEVDVFHQYLDKQYKKKIPFDVVFNLKSNDSMYCSEMIKKGLALATKNRIVIPTDHFTDRSKYKMISQYFKVPEKRFAGMEFIPIDLLFVNPDCQVLKRFVYE